ncbi:MAG: RNA polymerase sigma factor [Oscillospiraceae bacterium]|nr:RNA polymerase sigma factor [Oscillospiraceae bacterium]
MKQLVIQAKNCDANAFTELIRLNKQSMYRIAKSYLRNDDDVADAIQDAILTCYEKLHSLRSPEHFKTWLIKILINKCNDIIKREKRLVSLDTIQEEGHHDIGLSNIEFMMLISSLDESKRTVCVLRYGECLSVKEISEVLGISENAVKKRLERSREKMKATYITCEVGGML